MHIPIAREHSRDTYNIHEHVRFQLSQSNSKTIGLNYDGCILYSLMLPQCNKISLTQLYFVRIHYIFSLNYTVRVLF